MSMIQNYEANFVVILHFLVNNYAFDNILMEGNLSHDFYIIFSAIGINDGNWNFVTARCHISFLF